MIIVPHLYLSLNNPSKISLISFFSQVIKTIQYREDRFMDEHSDSHL